MTPVGAIAEKYVESCTKNDEPPRTIKYPSRVTSWTDQNGRGAKCDLQSYQLVRGDCAGMVIAIATERDDNPGMSVTNSAERLAKQICHDLHLPTTKLVLVERYKDNHGERYARVVFGRIDARELALPSWKHLTKEKLTAVLGRVPE